MRPLRYVFNSFHQHNVTRYSVLTDLDIFTRNLNATLFPGVSDQVWVHSGFADEHEKTVTAILAETKRLIAKKGATSVNLVS